MSAREVRRLRAEADELCDQARTLPQQERWRLYLRAGRLRDEAYLLDERDFYRRLDRSRCRAKMYDKVRGETT